MNHLSDKQIREMERLEKHGDQWKNTPKGPASRQMHRRVALRLKKRKAAHERKEAIAERRRNGGL